MGRVKRKKAFEHLQNVRIHVILHMRKVSSGHLLSMETFYSVRWFFADSESLDQTAHQRSLIWPSLSAYDPKVHLRLVGLISSNFYIVALPSQNLTYFQNFIFKYNRILSKRSVAMTACADGKWLMTGRSHAHTYSACTIRRIELIPETAGGTLRKIPTLINVVCLLIIAALCLSNLAVTGWLD